MRRTTYSVGLVVSAVACAVCALWVLPQLGPFPPVVVGIALTAIGFVTFAWLLATGPYVFRLDAEGLHDRSGVFQPGKLAWDEIESVKLVEAEGRAHMGLVLKDTARARSSLLLRPVLDEQRARFGADVVISPEAMGPAPASEHVALLQRFLASPEARAELAG